MFPTRCPTKFRAGGNTDKACRHAADRTLHCDSAHTLANVDEFVHLDPKSTKRKSVSSTVASRAALEIPFRAGAARIQVPGTSCERSLKWSVGYSEYSVACAVQVGNCGQLSRSGSSLTIH